MTELSLDELQASAERADALIFDCDGTLADTMPLHFVAWRDTLNRHSLEFSEDRFYAMAGQPTVHIIRILQEEQNKPGDAEAIAHEKELEFMKVLPQVKPIQPIVDLAIQYRGQKPMGVGSGSNHDVVVTVLEHIGLAGFFGGIVGAEQTPNPKPAPDVFLKVAEAIGAEPNSCCVYEDADLGIQSAKSAGMSWFDIRSVHTPERITSS